MHTTAWDWTYKVRVIIDEAFVRKEDPNLAVE